MGFPGVSNEMSHQERAVVTPQVIQGFNGEWLFQSCEEWRRILYNWIDLCKEAGSSVNGGQSVLNPWFIIGGVASTVCRKDEFIMLAIFTVTLDHIVITCQA